MEKKTFIREFSGRALKVEIGEFAQQANGSALISFGDTTILATAVMGRKPREHCDYMPLSVEYEERLYAAGKIKGSRFIKREGRPQDDAILSGRLIDRTLRPRFNNKIRHEIQVVLTVLSFDKENDPDVWGIFAASLALSISDIPWAGPVAAVRVGKVENEYLIDPTYAQREKSELDLIVSGTENKINMLEAGAKESAEATVLEAIAAGQKAYEELINFQKEIVQTIAPKKRDVAIKEPTADFEKKVKDFLAANNLADSLYIKDKDGRRHALDALRDNLAGLVKETEKEDLESKISMAIDMLDEETGRIVAKNILEKEKRPDARQLNEVRDINCQAGILPRTHGSALFRRGTTQALSAVTLGAPSEKQIIDGLEPEYKKRFLHHYNFPPFSVGETGPFRGPGRREIGHGALAERALLIVIPAEEQFPYTIRVVSEILSSNGSSSMASVCGSSLALMDAGVPIKAPCAGIAMGLIMGENDNSYKVLTDIQGPEDHHGDMDLKVAGTKDGVCAMQMDVKIDGVDLKILSDTLAQAKEARLFILGKMNAVIAEPRANLSEFAPRIITLQIDKDRIREVIGPGGKIINQIIDETGVKIDIEDTGIIFITSENEPAAQKALEWIKNIVRVVEAGEIFQGKVTRIMNFGAFVEILPGQEGLVHISELAPYRVNRVEDIVKIDDIVTVKVKEIDELGRINLSIKDAQNNDSNKQS